MAAAFIGVTRQTVAALEKGTSVPDVGQLVALANLYRAKLDEIVQAQRRPAPTAVPIFVGRLQKSELTAQDKEELVSFHERLRSRPLTASKVDFARPQFETIDETARRPRKALGVADSIPVPVFEMLRKCGLLVRFTALGDLAGALLITERDRPDGVLINSDQPYARQRHTAAHELGHKILGHGARAGVCSLGRRFDPAETQADQFAGELLVPIDALREHIRNLSSSEPLAHQVYRLAGTFMVSFQAMATRLAKLGALSPDAVGALEKIRVKDIEAALGTRKPNTLRSFKTTTLRNLADRVLVEGWQANLTAEEVRLLQEEAYFEYLASVPENERKDSAADVYAKVATWAGREYPVVRT